MSSVMFMICVSLLGGPASDHQQKTSHIKTQMAMASWYGDGFDGRLMANGDRFNKNDPTTAAHKSLRFGTKVELFNPLNGQSLTVEIRDRGPFKPGRSFDLSEAGAEKLGFIEEGLATLKVLRVIIPD